RWPMVYRIQTQSLPGSMARIVLVFYRKQRKGNHRLMIARFDSRVWPKGPATRSIDATLDHLRLRPFYFIVTNVKRVFCRANWSRFTQLNKPAVIRFIQSRAVVNEYT